MALAHKTETHRKYPRYTLRPHDEKGMRFSNAKRGSETFDTEIINISVSGMAFNCDVDVAPAIGETIKLEFQIPSDRARIAWFARVVWLESRLTLSMRRSTRARVGIEFHEMPEGHVKLLHQGIQARFRELYLEQRRKWILGIIRETAKLLFVIALAGGTAGFLYLLSNREANRDPNRPSAWGERFFNRVIPK